MTKLIGRDTSGPYAAARTIQCIFRIGVGPGGAIFSYIGCAVSDVDTVSSPRPVKDHGTATRLPSDVDIPARVSCYGIIIISYATRRRIYDAGPPVATTWRILRDKAISIRGRTAVTAPKTIKDDCALPNACDIDVATSVHGHAVRVGFVATTDTKSFGPPVAAVWVIFGQKNVITATGRRAVRTAGPIKYHRAAPLTRDKDVTITIHGHASNIGNGVGGTRIKCFGPPVAAVWVIFGQEDIIVSRRPTIAATNPIKHLRTTQSPAT